MSHKALLEAKLLRRIALGEHSRQQFKRTFNNPDSLAAELVAFSNGGGGTPLIGVNEDGSITGLDYRARCWRGAPPQPDAEQRRQPAPAPARAPAD